MKFIICALIVVASTQVMAADAATPVQAPNAQGSLQIECEGMFLSQQFSKTVTLQGTNKSEELVRVGKNSLVIGGSDKEMLLATDDHNILVEIYGQALLIQDASHNLYVKCLRQVSSK
ncbi:MAG TPA: hypothetical protein VF412_06535 [Bdellovibrio sp.]|uniref:hypothetical protein n=1 Tax=Bdellovibrio sp. TaxID=28201 RepID=UPI002F0A1B26